MSPRVHKAVAFAMLLVLAACSKGSDVAAPPAGSGREDGLDACVLLPVEDVEDIVGVTFDAAPTDNNDFALGCTFESTDAEDLSAVDLTVLLADDPFAARRGFDALKAETLANGGSAVPELGENAFQGTQGTVEVFVDRFHIQLYYEEYGDRGKRREASIEMMREVIASLAGTESAPPSPEDKWGARSSPDAVNVPSNDRLMARLAGDVKGLESGLNAYWRDKFANSGPFRGGSAWQDVPIRGYHTDNAPPCGHFEVGKQAAKNAFFCEAGWFIAFDVDWFYQNVKIDPNDAVTYYILAHEWGHAAQRGAGIDKDTSRIFELQADCLAGAYLGDRIAEGSLVLEPADQDLIMKKIDSIADPEGTPTDMPDGHGTAGERRDAYNFGLGQSAEACTSRY